ncbi:rod shape-determining protein MreD [Radicibacter daui]|uniref:rod shape-determining protein MreD n=1 Tax=Radicibacter daui TaxID=3064829 RepID=UPI004046FB15
MTFLTKLDHFARHIVPGLTVAVLVVLGLMPLPLPYYGPVSPSLSFAAVYFWSIHRPDLLPPWACFVLGLFLDLLLGVPPGLNAMVFVLTHWILGSQLKFFRNQSFSVLWGCFIVICFGAGLLQWVLVCLFEFAFVSPIPALIRAGLTAAFLPFVSWILGRVEKLVLPN